MFLITKSLPKEKEKPSILLNLNQHKEKRRTSAWKVDSFLLQTLWQEVTLKCAVWLVYLYKASDFAAWGGYPKKVPSLVGCSWHSFQHIHQYDDSNLSFFQPISLNPGWVYVTLSYNIIWLWRTAGMCSFHWLVIHTDFPQDVRDYTPVVDWPGSIFRGAMDALSLCKCLFYPVKPSLPKCKKSSIFGPILSGEGLGMGRWMVMGHKQDPATFLMCYMNCGSK